MAKLSRHETEFSGTDDARGNNERSGMIDSSLDLIFG